MRSAWSRSNQRGSEKQKGRARTLDLVLSRGPWPVLPPQEAKRYLIWAQARNLECIPSLGLPHKSSIKGLEFGSTNC